MSVLDMIERDLQEQGLSDAEIRDALEKMIDLGNYAAYQKMLAEKESRKLA